MLVLVLTLAVIVPASASWATLDSGEFNSAVNALQLVDPTIDPPPAGENWALVVGGGRTECPSFAISARSGPEGEDPQGVLALVQSACGGENFTARVTCLAVEGIFAGVGGVIVQSNFTPIIGMPFVAAFGDPGMPSGTGDTFALAVGVPAEACPMALVGGDPIVHGNILIRDA